MLVVDRFTLSLKAAAMQTGLRLVTTTSTIRTGSKLLGTYIAHGPGTSLARPTDNVSCP